MIPYRRIILIGMEIAYTLQYNRQSFFFSIQSSYFTVCIIFNRYRFLSHMSSQSIVGKCLCDLVANVKMSSSYLLLLSFYDCRCEQKFRNVVNQDHAFLYIYIPFRTPDIRSLLRFLFVNPTHDSIKCTNQYLDFSLLFLDGKQYNISLLVHSIYIVGKSAIHTNNFPYEYRIYEHDMNI